MRTVLRSLSVVGVLLISTVGMAQTRQPVLRFTFDSDDGGWAGVGANCRASITTQTSYNGAGALKFEYDLRPRAMGLLTYLTQDANLSEVQGFRFWIRADQNTTLAFFVQEKGGGRFSSLFAVQKGVWQKVEIAVEDLILNEGKDDPKDADGKLNMDRVEALAIGDLAQFIAQADSSEFARLLGLELGPRVILMDDFMALSEKLPAAIAVSGREARLDTFARPQVGWLATCPVSIVRDSEPPLLKAAYRTALGRIVVLGRMFPKGTLKGMARLSFTATSTQPTMLLVQVEEAGGGKFNTVVDLSGGGSAKNVTVDLANMNPADDSPVRDRSVKPELISQVIFIDASALLGGGNEQENTLTLHSVRGLPAPQ